MPPPTARELRYQRRVAAIECVEDHEERTNWPEVEEGLTHSGIVADAVGLSGGAVRPLSPSLMRLLGRAADGSRDAGALCDELGLEDAAKDSVNAALAVLLRNETIKVSFCGAQRHLNI